MTVAIDERRTRPRSFDECIEALAPLRASLLAHPMHRAIRDAAALRAFTEHHVWAVWDFMSLLKAIQARFTRTRWPWTPKGDPMMCRFVNEIVLAEESDTSSRGPLSHFELYRLAMAELGADTGPIDRALAELDRGTSLEVALAVSGGPPAALDFTRQTFRTLREGSDAALIGLFTLSREDLIPDLFRAVVAGLAASGTPATLLLEYLDRHIGIDENEHGPMARRMLETECADDPDRWTEALTAAASAFEARLRLWDAVLARAGGSMRTASPALGDAG